MNIINTYAIAARNARNYDDSFFSTYTDDEAEDLDGSYVDVGSEKSPTAQSPVTAEAPAVTAPAPLGKASVTHANTHVHLHTHVSMNIWINACLCLSLSLCVCAQIRWHCSFMAECWAKLLLPVVVTKPSSCPLCTSPCLRSPRTN